MKKTIASILVTATLTAFTGTPATETRSVQSLSQEIVLAFQKSSQAEYLQLLPSTHDFHEIMEENSSVYGQYLADAQADFSKTYAESIVPAARTSFDKVLSKAKALGIDWSSVDLKHVDASPVADELTFVTITLEFAHAGESYLLTIDKALVWKGTWRASQFVSLEKKS